jgi:hypothetical protein
MAKRSRRERRQETEKRRTTIPGAPEVVETNGQNIPSGPAAQVVAPTLAASNRKTVNFAEEYHYVYAELRNIIIIATLMLAVMIGLSFVI